ncbi:MAG TPA: response regulator [Anaerolineae bacterium]|nr:response regulator [Anaerolineae bacterium]
MAKILIVDDARISRRMLRLILETTEHTIIEASNGPDAISLYAQEKPDLVFLDMTMRDMHGLEVLKRLRELDPNAKIIIATGDIQQHTKDETATAGAIDFMIKPFKTQIVHEVLKNALN